MDEWRRDREAMQHELAAELRGDLSKEEEARLQSQLRDKETQAEELRKRSRVKTREALTLEEAFAKIRQATGVSTLDEMVEKFLGQGANRSSLEEEKKAAERSLSDVKAQRDALQKQFAELKASGVGGTELNRDLYDRLDAKLAKAKASLKVNKASCDRIEAVLVAVRQGAVGLSQRLAPFSNLISPSEELELPHTVRCLLRIPNSADRIRRVSSHWTCSTCASSRSTR